MYIYIYGSKWKEKRGEEEEEEKKKPSHATIFLLFERRFGNAISSFVKVLFVGK